MEAHHIPYVAMTSAAFPADVYDKMVKARGIKGLRYLHMNTPCPSGWGFDPKDSVELGKLSVDTGLVVLYEVVEGVFRLTGKSASMARSGRRKPVAEYLATQSRFRSVSPEAAEEIQAWADERWNGYVGRHQATLAAEA
jgi:pyruvate/2-oxoacid:ferredoxin oxidoreductase beta subunit